MNLELLGEEGCVLGLESPLVLGRSNLGGRGPELQPRGHSSAVDHWGAPNLEQQQEET